MKKNRINIRQFVIYGVFFIAVVIAGIGFYHYTSDKIQVETIAVDDIENNPLYAERSEAAELIDDKININTASSELLQSINGIGKVTAERIISYREKNGPFKTTESIMDVNGIGKKTYEEIKDKICAE